jgi:hypothetical protein
LLKADIVVQNFTDLSSASVFTNPVDTQIVTLAYCKTQLDNAIQLTPAGPGSHGPTLLQLNLVHETPNFLFDEVRILHGV